MRSHWEEVERTFRALAYMAKSADPDGIEVCFSSSPEKQTWFRHTTPAIRAIRTRMFDRTGDNSENNGEPGRIRNCCYCGLLGQGIESALNRLLEEAESRGSRPKARPTTIIVLTDRRVANTALDWRGKLGKKLASLSNSPLQCCASVHFPYFGEPAMEADPLRSYRLERYVSEPPGLVCGGTTQRHVSRIYCYCCYW